MVAKIKIKNIKVIVLEMISHVIIIFVFFW